ncbi:MAG TPA: TIGR03084 family metal-binding protein [Acidimicrobiales bacterium]|nr:TIGR03084 family metal-binding protein [Acidimicrobiales bacterium]
MDLDQLLADLREETGSVDHLLAGLDDEGWNLPTPAAGWAIRDQVSHLAYFDDAAVMAAIEPDRFMVEARSLEARGPDFATYLVEQYRPLAPEKLRGWFLSSRNRLLETFSQLDSHARVPWYSQPMSVASAVTARIMESWAHGQDIADALGVERRPNARLRHIAHLGVHTFGFSFTLHGLDVPTTPLRVELTAPDGTAWVWGDPAADDVVRGPAADFCLVVTQRRNVADTSLVTKGAVARRWLGIAQAFAGAAGRGRPPSGADHG